MPFLPRIDSNEDGWTNICRSSEHNPPGMIVLSPGRHDWQCPSCGHVTVFYVPGVFC